MLTTIVMCGMISWYGNEFHGRRTASGEIFDQQELTAAHKNLAFGTKIRILNKSNGKEVIVTITDRGPFNKRVLDVSKETARQLGFMNRGVTQACYEIIQ